MKKVLQRCCLLIKHRLTINTALVSGFLPVAARFLKAPLKWAASQETQQFL